MAAKRNSAETPKPKLGKLTGVSVEIPESVIVGYIASLAGLDDTGMRLAGVGHDPTGERVVVELYSSE